MQRFKYYLFNLLIALSLLSFNANAVCIYGVGIYGEGIYGYCPPSGGQQEGGGGSEGSINIPYDLTIPFGYGLSNGTCAVKQQLFDQRCYDCNPTTSYIEFNPDDRSVLCYTCKEGYAPIENKCVEAKTFNVTMTYGDMSMLAVAASLLIFWYLQKKKKPRKKQEEYGEGEDEDLE